MSAFASYAGARIVAGTLLIPLYGMWSADITLAADTLLDTNAPLVLGNLTLTGNVYRQASFAGLRQARLVAGYGGWRTTLPRKPYNYSGGVKASLVLGDAAIESGEKINVPNDSVIGADYVRQEAPGSRVLRQLVGDAGWYIDPSGVTQIAAWPTTKIGSAFTVEHQDCAAGRFSIATEDYASWMPGATFSSVFLSGTYTVSSSQFTFADDGKLRLEVLAQ